MSSSHLVTAFAAATAMACAVPSFAAEAPHMPAPSAETSLSSATGVRYGLPASAIDANKSARIVLAQRRRRPRRNVRPHARRRVVRRRKSRRAGRIAGGIAAAIIAGIIANEIARADQRDWEYQCRRWFRRCDRGNVSACRRFYRHCY